MPNVHKKVVCEICSATVDSDKLKRHKIRNHSNTVPVALSNTVKHNVIECVKEPSTTEHLNEPSLIEEPKENTLIQHVYQPSEIIEPKESVTFQEDLKKLEFVYCFGTDSMPNVYKIGYTCDVEKRLKEANQGAFAPPKRYWVAWAKNVFDGKKVEKFIHNAIEKSRITIRREFFELEPYEVVALKQYCRSYGSVEIPFQIPFEEYKIHYKNSKTSIMDLKKSSIHNYILKPDLL